MHWFVCLGRLVGEKFNVIGVVIGYSWGNRGRSAHPGLHATYGADLKPTLMGRAALRAILLIIDIVGTDENGWQVDFFFGSSRCEPGKLSDWRRKGALGREKITASIGSACRCLADGTWGRKAIGIFVIN